MFLHYLKVAFRNLLRYKLQSIVSLFSLAIGFSCISLSLFWNHYEVTYDSFHKNADRIYKVQYLNDYLEIVSTPVPLGGYLKEKYPEIDGVCSFDNIRWPISIFTNINIPTKGIYMLIASPEFPKLFDMEWLEGNGKMETWRDNHIAISDQLAKQICGNTPAIGFKLTTNENGKEKEYEVVAVYKTWSAHSNLKFEIVKLLEMDNSWNSSMVDTYVMLNRHAHVDNFIQKLKQDTIRYGYRPQVYNKVTPLSAVHYTYPEKQPNVNRSDVRLFTIASVLLSVCALVNYLVLFISRLRNRGRDMALRSICGSSGRQLSGLLLTEYLLLLLGALVVSLLLIELCMSQFMELSMIQVERVSIYQACLYLLLFVLVLASVLSMFPIYYFRQKTLRVQIDSVAPRLGKNHLRLVGVCLQLVVSMFFMFCAMVMMRQVYFLIHSDINIERKNIAAIWGPEHTLDILNKIPSITEAIQVETSLFPAYGNHSIYSFTSWDGKAADASPISVKQIRINGEIAQFYNLQMKEGYSNFDDLSKDECVVNEALVKAMNVSEPIGKTLKTNWQELKIKGVIFDYPVQSPTEPVTPLAFVRIIEMHGRTWAFKYEGDFNSCKEAIKEAMRGERFVVIDGEETYNSYLKSEYNLLKLLGVVTVVSLLIALFGIYALIVQACEKHRKEIAIRRVNGAQVGDILLMFFKQYMAQVVVAAAVAFPVGYVLMKRWLENYTLQVGIGFWVFASIFLGTAVLVTLCIGWHVWRAANENPARVIRKE